MSDLRLIVYCDTHKRGYGFCIRMYQFRNPRKLCAPRRVWGDTVDADNETFTKERMAKAKQ